MALRLRRGTDGERLSVTPKAGELVSTTDTKRVYVGDGTTIGGNVVGALELNDLADVEATGPSNGQGLVWSSSANAFILEDLAAVDVQGDITGSVFGDDSTLLVDGVNSLIVGNVNTSSVVATNIYGTLDGDVNGDVVGSLTGNVTGTVTGSLNGFVRGELIGSVFAEDSTQLINANNASAQLDTITANNLTVNNTVDIDGGINAAGNIQTTDPTRAYLYITRKDTSTDLDGVNTPHGTLAFSYEGSTPTINPQATISGSRRGLLFVGDENGITDLTPESNKAVWRQGKLGLGTRNPSQVLEVQGNAYVNGEIIGTEIKISANNIVTQNTNANVRIAPSGTGTLELDVPTQSTVGPAGGASALPASPDLYFKINVGGNEYVIPAFGVS